MRTTILLSTFISVCSSLSTSAQIEKGDILLGGSLGYYQLTSSQNDADNSASNTNINPRISFGAGTNSQLGLKLGYGNSYTRSELSPQKTVHNTFSAGIFWRKYFPLEIKKGLAGMLNLPPQ